MSTIQQTEYQWAAGGKFLRPGKRTSKAAIGAVLITIGCASIFIGLDSENEILQAVGSLVIGAAVHQLYMVVIDLFNQIRLLRDELQSSYRANEVNEAELRGARTEIGFLRPQTDVGKAELSPR